MKVIKKKISLEQFKSRTPSMIDFFDNDGDFVDLNFSTINDISFKKILDCYPMGNYGETPCDVKITYNNNTPTTEIELKTIFGDEFDVSLVKSVKSYKSLIDDFSDIYFSSSNCYNIETKYYVLTYGVLHKLYLFFLYYNSLLSDKKTYGKEICYPTISSATQYWEYIVKDETKKPYYMNLDKQFAQYGGSISVNAEGQVIYEKMDDFIINQIFRTFHIDTDFIDCWKTETLSTLDAIKWYKWFETRYPQYSGKTETFCSEFTIDTCNGEKTLKNDCCDCTEYFKRGGDGMFLKLKNFIEKFRDIETSSASTSIDLQIFIPITIDDIGEYTILSEEWEGGVNYKPNICTGMNYSECGDITILSGGTTVVYDDDIWLKLCDGYGSEINDCKTSFDFTNSEWIKYIDVHKTEIIEYETDRKYNEYAFNENGLLYAFPMVNPKIESANSPLAATEMALKYDLIKSEYGWIYYKNILTKIEHFPYIFDPKSKKYLKVETDGNKEFVYYNNRKYFAYKNAKGATVINLSKIPCIRELEADEITINEATEFVKIKDTYYKVGEDIFNVGNNIFTIGEYKYQIINAYFTINGTKYFIINGRITEPIPTYITAYNTNSAITTVLNESFSVLLTDLTTVNSETRGYYVTDNQIFVYTPYFIYNFGFLSGTTTSKVNMFEIQNKCCDDMGNTLPGYFQITSTSTFAQPLEGETIDLTYHANTIRNLSDVDSNNLIYWGNILYDMLFYYENNGIKTTEEISVRDHNFNNLDALEEAKNKWIAKYSKESSIPSDTLKCKFVYYLGAILTAKTKTDNLEIHPNSFFQGVKYIDICTLEKKSMIYHVSSEIKYSINFYDIIWEKMNVKYGDKIIQLPKTYYEVHIDNEMPKNTNDVSFSKYNNLMYSPIFKEEYKMGMATQQNIDENIYIERAIMKPCEKNLQLLDILTFNALEKYGNGTIKIINS